MSAMMRMAMMAAQGSAGESGPADPHWANVVSLLHFDGADASTTFTDEAGNTWTAHGNAQIDTAQSMFGGASGLFDGTGDYLSSTFASGLPLSEVFTLEGYARFNSLASDGGLIFLGNIASNDNRVQIDVRSNGSSAFFAALPAAVDQWNIVAPNGTFTVGPWYHVAAVKNGTSAVLYVDGNSVASTGSAGTTPNTGSTAYLATARRSNAQRVHNGWLDEWRITDGVARYTSNFTPPTAPFPNS